MRMPEGAPIAGFIARALRSIGALRQDARGTSTRYEAEWERYSQQWERNVRDPARDHLGDEWATGEFTTRVVERFARPYVNSASEVLEIGCGGGKFSVHLAPLCRTLVCQDVSASMLERTRARLGETRAVRFVKGDGLTLRPLPDACIDFVFSFDVFVHLDVEDVFGYLEEIHRVLRPGGRGILHCANLLTTIGWSKFVAEAPHQRGGRPQVGRFVFLVPAMAERLCSGAGLVPERIDGDVNGRDFVVVYQRRA